MNRTQCIAVFSVISFLVLPTAMLQAEIPPAVIKAENKGDAWLADRIYSGVPASWFGRHQEIEIGHQSGLSNVRYWLKKRGITESPEVERAVFELAKSSNRTLSEDEIMAVVRAHA